jgi:hypothetical protein
MLKSVNKYNLLQKKKEKNDAEDYFSAARVCACGLLVVQGNWEDHSSVL